MLGSMLRRLLRKPFSLAIVGVLAVVLVAALFLANRWGGEALLGASFDYVSEGHWEWVVKVRGLLVQVPNERGAEGDELWLTGTITDSAVGGLTKTVNWRRRNFMFNPGLDMWTDQYLTDRWLVKGRLVFDLALWEEDKDVPGEALRGGNDLIGSWRAEITPGRRTVVNATFNNGVPGKPGANGHYDLRLWVEAECVATPGGYRQKRHERTKFSGAPRELLECPDLSD
ncbi:MAG: hypothetical protein HYX92_02220 [Chloroflexi bacterium]|nr:hypothetical protein [Chloroflexota bacterium]